MKKKILGTSDYIVQHGYQKPENPRKKPVRAGTGRDRFGIFRLQVSQTQPEEV